MFVMSSCRYIPLGLAQIIISAMYSLNSFLLKFLENFHLHANKILLRDGTEIMDSAFGVRGFGL